MVRVLRRHAPSWLVQMPSLLTAAELKTLQRQTSGVTRERMLRELADAVEAMSSEHPMVLWLEDLHWSDVSTLDWLAYVGGRPEPARLLVLGSYRVVEVLAWGHPLKAVKDELEVHGRCREQALSLLSRDAIGQWLTHRFRPSAASATALAALASVIHRRTDGNPLFVAHVVTDLVSRGVLVERDGLWDVTQDAEAVQVAIPHDVRTMIAGQLDRVSLGERRVLESASAAGAEFSAAAVAAAAEIAIDDADACCAELARRELFLIALDTDEWPDGTLSGRYGFRHALYQEVVNERVLPARLVEFHRRIGARIEAAFRDRAGEAAVELAMHFRRGRDTERAIRYLHLAGEIATRRSAAQEAIGHLTEALDLLRTLPETTQRAQREVALQIALGPPLMATKGWAAPEVERVYARAQELCQSMNDPPQLFQALWGLWLFRLNSAEFARARELGDRLLTLAHLTDDTAIAIEARHAQWTPLFVHGELAVAHDHIERAIALYDPDQHAFLASVYGHHDPIVCGRALGAWALELLGECELATRYSEVSIALARRLGHPFSEIHALVFAAFLHRMRDDAPRTRALSHEAATIARGQGFVQLLARATTMRGWAMAQMGEVEEGIAHMREGIEATRALGPTFLPYFLGSLAEGYVKAGRFDRALDALTEALATVQRTGERFYEAELHRLQGELLLLGPEDERGAEQCFQAALEIARRQAALTFERRATKSLRKLSAGNASSH
jgi:predicted ATPase